MVWARGHIPFPGATFVEMIRKLSRENSLTTGKVAFGGRIRELSSITAPFLNIYGSKDHVAPPESVKPLTGLVGSQKAEQRELNAGHIGCSSKHDAAQNHAHGHRLARRGVSARPGRSIRHPVEQPEIQALPSRPTGSP